MKSEHILHGIVGHGLALGRTVGMPTANLIPDYEVGDIEPGVYASLVKLGDETFLGVTNVGTRPTVDNAPETVIETLILDFDRDIYGAEMDLTLTHYLRPIRKMASLEEVKAQVEKDSKRTREYLSADL